MVVECVGCCWVGFGYGVGLGGFVGFVVGLVC